MGNDKSCQQGSPDQFLLTREQFSRLRVNDKIDHRDYQGRYVPAQIVTKRGFTVTVHYVGWSDKYDKTVKYTSAPTDFAQAGSISKSAATGPLCEYTKGDYVKYRPVGDDSSKWRKAVIVKMDNKYNSGQVKVQYKNSTGKECERWTHLDNQFEILAIPAQINNNNNNGRKKNQSRRSSHNHQHSHNNYNCNNNNNYYNNQYQQYEQVQVKKQDQMTVRTQLLLDDTEQQCKMIKDYLDGINSGKSKDEIQQFNQMVVAGLTLFDMKVGGMRKNSKSDKLNFNDAFKSAAMIIKKFENDCKSQFGHNQFLMQRLEPCLNYMRAVLYGKDVPPLPYIKDYEFNQQIAGNVISDVAHAQNHVLPARMKEINDNNGKYKKNQHKLKQEYEAGGYNDNVHDIDFKNLTQDYNTSNVSFGKTKQEQDAIIAEQMNQYRYQKPDIMNGDGMDVE
mmetsp:Transcript_14578/g.13080  ORF Transcript_14578/g.13080 Transcript_14578/m.13080 type:complete len:448 (+) Transcript_14578:159-1502(+)